MICVSYRPPDCPLDCFDNLLKPNYTFKRSYCVNSFSFLATWTAICMLKDNRHQKALSDVSRKLNLTLVINTPTRITNNCQSLIDVISTSSPSLVRNSGVLNIPISDHLPVFATRKLKPPKKPPCYITVRSFKHYDPSSFTYDLAANSDRLLSPFSEKDVNTKLTSFDDIFHSTLDMHAPIKTCKVRIADHAHMLQPKINNLWELEINFTAVSCRHARNSTDWNHYKESRNFTKISLKNAAEQYTLDEVQKHKKNPSSLWKIVNQNIPSKDRESHVYNKDPMLVADDFNQFFTSVGRNVAAAL